MGKEHLGRGYRKIKNTNYYSPAEEEERHKHKEIIKEREKGIIPFLNLNLVLHILLIKGYPKQF